MRFNSAFIPSFFLASAVLADRRREHQSRLLDRVEHTNTHSDGVQYTTNWAGAVWIEKDGALTHVTGTFTVPTPSGRSGDAASAWVGIDGDSDICNGGLLQTGVDFTVTNDGASYDAWYEWYPNYSYYFSNLDVSAGDVIRASVTASSATSGTAVVENLTNGQSATQQINSTYALCGLSAEWIVEDFEDSNNKLVPFANFGEVTFSDAVATGAGTYTPHDATIVDISQDNKVLTSTRTNGSSLTVKYL
ncbi:peptidase G1 [Boletus edulis BED1]|uniref:Peptidase G1 n=1 Tax=Boletus edulis BED1 TaxID=1328754 RepID=A0AAD4C8Z5_BOLED|nr:peptidase G1 [Boletus edulis BED1]